MCYILCLAFSLGSSVNPCQFHFITGKLTKGEELYCLLFEDPLCAGCDATVVYPVAKEAGKVPTAALTKPTITDGSQRSLNLKLALSSHVIAQPFRRDTS